MTPADLAAIEARGVQSTDDALVMADAILDDPDGGVEWLMAHGCDALDRLRVEVRRLRALTADRDALAARLAALRVAATLVRDAQAVAAAAKARYEATWGTADGAPVRTDAEKITAALTAWHVAGDALDTALGALVADATGRPCAWPVAP